MRTAAQTQVHGTWHCSRRKRHYEMRPGGQRPSADLRDRAGGCLVSLTIGDALGTAPEFSERDTKPHQTEMTGGGPFGSRPGEGTETR